MGRPIALLTFRTTIADFFTPRTQFNFTILFTNVAAIILYKLTYIFIAPLGSHLLRSMTIDFDLSVSAILEK